MDFVSCQEAMKEMNEAVDELKKAIEGAIGERPTLLQLSLLEVTVLDLGLAVANLEIAMSKLKMFSHFLLPPPPPPPFTRHPPE